MHVSETDISRFKPLDKIIGNYICPGNVFVSEV